MIILHIITSLEFGGSQNILLNMCKNDIKNEHLIISLKKIPNKRNLDGIKVYNVEINFLNFFFELFKISKIIRTTKPNVIQSWLYHADFITIFLKIFFPKISIYWNIRSSNLKFRNNSNTIIIRTINSFFSYYIPKKIIFCSKESQNLHIKYLYYKKIFTLINNGVDINKLDINLHNKETIHIGCNARFHSMKDHQTLFKALNLLKKSDVNFHLHLIGDGISSYNINLINLLNENNIKDVTEIYNVTNNIYNFYKKINLHILPSIYGESFSNVILETLSCGIFNISTDVGNSKKILGDFGLIYKKKDEVDLLNKILLFNKDKKNYQSLPFKKNMRNFVKNEFSLEKMIIDYNSVWLN